MFMLANKIIINGIPGVFLCDPNITILKHSIKLNTQESTLIDINGTPPYSHLVIMPTLFWLEQKLRQLLSYFNQRTPLRPLFTQADLYGLLVTRLMGFHCNYYSENV